MDIVRIVPPSGEGVRSGCGTQVLMPDGAEVPFVTAVTVTFAPDGPVKAEVEVAVDFVKEIATHPLLGLDTLKASAERYGLQLIPSDGTVSCVTLAGKTIHRTGSEAPDPLSELTRIFRKWDAVGFPEHRDVNIEYPQLKF